MFLAVIIALCAIIKILAALEWSPLYRAFLFVPARLLSFFFSTEYTEQGGVYFFPGFILDHSCSGIHFFMVAALVACVHAPRTWGGFLSAISSAFVLTIAANAARVGLFLKLTAFSSGRPWLHEIIGSVVFVSFLLSYYLLRDLKNQRVQMEKLCNPKLNF